MMDKKVAQMMMGRQTADDIRATQVVLPTGNYAAIMDDGKRKVVLVLTNDVAFADGPVTISEFCESTIDPVSTRRLTLAHSPEDLGAYATLTIRHQPLWQAIMRSPHAPDSGLDMVQAIDFLHCTNTAINDDAISNGLIQFKKLQSTAADDSVDSQLDKFLNSSLIKK